MSIEPAKNLEPLPGYRLLEKIGSGGYGEVWKVEAPGGLVKAMKFVFGTEHEKRATHELKSLKRIKELRHPFLLSLERIEIVEGRLLVVTELAEGSLMDRFDECNRQGMPGIPRDELLRYLCDAADALDYMVEAHSLQHLDIKPENLLLSGGHVKVADFGLVKSIQQSQASIVGGMTPLYSAPEVFRGKPGQRCDQYSLAILYQEMLTGMLPFSGETAAELTLQHLNDDPGLAPLVGPDRYVVARALAKDPGHRYSSCRQFIEALIAYKSSPQAPAEPASANEGARCSTAVPAGERPKQATEVFDDDVSPSADQPMLIDIGEEGNAEVIDLPPVDFSPADFQPSSTLFLGVGGVGGRVMAQLRRRMQARFGSPDRLPAMKMLLLDTDPKAIMTVSRDDRCGFSVEETLALPLRRPQNYRENSSRLLKWLSRRWLYNIPKSMRTEGLRPLGRLALVDHARQACQRIRQAIAQATDDLNKAQSRDAIGLPLAEDACRVYVIASIAGGTGSGMVLDLGYAVRAALEKQGVQNAEIIGILTHSTSRDSRTSDLARVNSYSCLSEYHHYARHDVAYPGDESCGLPAHPSGTPPFDHTYLVHLGEAINEDDFDHALDAVSEYIYLDSLTSANTCLGACRRDDQPQTNSASRSCQLRTFGLHRVDAAPSNLSESFADQVSQRVLDRWLSGGEDDQTGAAGLLERLPLTTPRLAAQTRVRLRDSLGSDEAEFVEGWLNSQQPVEAQLEVSDVFKQIDLLFRKNEDGGPEGTGLVVGKQPVVATVEPLIAELRTAINDWIVGMLDDSKLRLGGARRGVDEITGILQSIQDESHSLSQRIASQLVRLRNQAQTPCEVADQATTGDDISPLSYFQMRLDHCAMIATGYVTAALAAELRSQVDLLNQFGRDVKQIVGHFETQQFDGAASAGDGQATALADELTPQLDDLAAAVDRRIQECCTHEQGALLTAVTEGGRTRAQLLARLKELSQEAIQEVLSNVNVLENSLAQNEQGSLGRLAEQTSPPLLRLGGARRLMVVLPASTSRQANEDVVRQSLEGDASYVTGDDNSFTLCVEAQSLSLKDVALHLVQQRRDYVEFAERVHCRNDVSWSKVATASPSAPAGTTRSPQATMAIGNDAPQEN